MSAFVVDQAHINAIVTWANHFHRQLSSDTMADDPERLGQLLLDANIASVNYRYAHKPEAQSEPEKFVWRPSRARELTAVEAIKALQCLDYQSCEVQDWRASREAKIISALKSVAISELPGYDTAPWSID
jgi:hypothetical protein